MTTIQKNISTRLTKLKGKYKLKKKKNKVIIAVILLEGEYKGLVISYQHWCLEALNLLGNVMKLLGKYPLSCSSHF